MSCRLSPTLTTSCTTTATATGIIDILQEYTLKKRAAKLVKSVVHEARQLSTVEPPFYASRFCAFVESVISDDRRAHRRTASRIQLQEDCPISI